LFKHQKLLLAGLLFVLLKLLVCYTVIANDRTFNSKFEDTLLIK